MTVLDSKTYNQDLNKTISSIKNYKSLKNKTIFITGSTGLICSAFIDLLQALNKQRILNLTIYASGRNIKSIQKRFNTKQNTNIIPIKFDVTKTLSFKPHVDFFIHGASNASPDKIISEPVETMISNFNGLNTILKLSHNNNARTLYISSSEVYGQLQTSNSINEEQCGYIDNLNPRNSYGEAKRATETLCASYIKEYNSDIVIVRPGHIYGPTASQSDIRVSSKFMYDAAHGKKLILKSKGQQLRSYTYCLDCANAILTVLLTGEAGEAYNISNPDSIISISTMANYFANSASVKLEYNFPTKEEKSAFNPMSNSSLDSTKLEALGWKPNFNQEEGFQHSIKIIQEIIS